MANFRSLQAFIDQENRWAAIFGNDPLPLDVRQLTQEQADQLFQKLDGNMSPENLHCDGEISAAQARRKAKLFTAAFEDLKKLGFQPTEKLWCRG